MKNWKDYPSEPCPKCGSEDSEVFTKSEQPYWVYDGEEARCKECGNKGYINADDGLADIY